jgi:hypothetical protein
MSYFIFINFQEPFNFLLFHQWPQWSLSNALFSFQLFACFLPFFLLLSSSFTALWSDRMHDIIFIFLYLLRLALCPKIWSILEKVPWDAEKNAYCAEVQWNILARSIGSMVWFKSRISLLIFFVGMTYLLVIGGY